MEEPELVFEPLPDDALTRFITENVIFTYAVFGRLDDYPTGHAKLFLSKRLDAPAE
jgi:hypothetical protein